MNSPVTLTRAEIQAVYEQGADAMIGLVERLLEEMARLSERVRVLEERLAQDSHNSSKPPSGDGWGEKPKPKSQRPKSGKKPGSQPGHPGKTLAMTAEPDVVVVHSPQRCVCGLELAGVTPVERQRRQVVDLPELHLAVTEHQVERKRCPRCGAWTQGTFPAGVTQPVQYGPRVKALSVYLSAYQMVPYGRLREMWADVFGVSVSAGLLQAAWN